MTESHYTELMHLYRGYVEAYNALYTVKTDDEAEIRKIYQFIKCQLIETKIASPFSILSDIESVLVYINRYVKSYLLMAKMIYEEYQVQKIPTVLWNLLNREYGIPPEKRESSNKGIIESKFFLKLMENQENNQIIRSIMYDDKRTLITIAENDSFDKDQEIMRVLYPWALCEPTLLGLCCYYGSVGCFKYLKTRFEMKIAPICIELSFLGGDPDIINECLKVHQPNINCMRNAIFTHNIDYVTFLKNEYGIEIDLEFCAKFKNPQAFFAYYDMTDDYNKCFVYSPLFNIRSICDYFLSRGADVNARDNNGGTALHVACFHNIIDIAEYLLLNGADINIKDNNGATAFRAAIINQNLEIAELLLSHGANVDDRNNNGDSALQEALFYIGFDTAKFLISHGANINSRNDLGLTILHQYMILVRYMKPQLEFLFSNGIDVNVQDNKGRTALHYAVASGFEEITSFLISHGADTEIKDIFGKTPLQLA